MQRSCYCQMIQSISLSRFLKIDDHLYTEHNI